MKLAHQVRVNGFDKMSRKDIENLIKPHGYYLSEKTIQGNDDKVVEELGLQATSMKQQPVKFDNLHLQKRQSNVTW